jgi:subtilisin-like proprotein convertase family protein
MKNFVFRTLYLSTAFLIAACGGGGGNIATPASTTGDVLAPSIASFSSANSTISAGASTTLTAVFSNGTGTINNAVGNVSSGVAVSVNPTATTTYNLTVTNSAGASVTAAATVSVLPASTSVTPIPLALGTSDLPFATTIATNTNSYFKITGLTTGHRYTFDIATTNYPTITYYSDAYTTPIACDPNDGAPCSIIAPGTAIWIRIYNSSYFNASTATINATHVSAPTEFEGAWNVPVPFIYSAASPTHVGKVDEHISYYDIQGLTLGKTYTVWTQSMTDDVRMGTLDPVSQTWVGGYCSPGNMYLNGASNPENCTWTATSTHLAIGIENTSLAAAAAYILRVEEAIASEGSAVAPVTLSYSAGKAEAAGRVAAGGASYYRVLGLQAGVAYSLNLNRVERPVAANTYDPPVLKSYNNDSTYSTISACTLQAMGYSPSQCILTAAGTDLFFKVVGPTQFSGMTYNISVTPVPVNEGTSTPVALNFTALPYTGQVYDWFSEYAISGLAPNTFYQVFMNNITGLAGLEAWDNTASGIYGGDSGQQTATWFLNSGPNGVINVRSGNGNALGSFYTLTMTQGPQLTAAHRDTSGPIAIQDPTAALNPVTPTSIPIVVSGDPVTSISNVTVELFIKHGITSQLKIELVAPDGVTTVTLAAKTTLSGNGIYGLKLNDYARAQVEVGYSPYYGTYQPHTPLHVLNGMNANGTWTLRITDDEWANTMGQTGEYFAWGITFN